MKDQKLELYFFFVAFVAILILTFILFLPFLGALALSLVLAVIFHPIYLKILSVVRVKGLAALLSVLLVLTVVFAPLFFLGFVLFNEAQNLFIELNQGGGTGIHTTIQFIEAQINKFAPSFTIDVGVYFEQGLNWLTQSFGDIFAGTAQVVVSFLIGLIALYYFFRDGDWFKEVFVVYSPLRDTYDNEILVRVRRTINSILKGSILVAVIQGILTGLGFAFFGVPNPALWGAFAALGALIPGVGTTIVFIPAIAYVYFFVGEFMSLGLLLWGVLAVGLIDNFLGPILIGRGVRIHPLLVLLAVIGGLKFFGPIGFLLGPIVFSLLLALTEIYNFLVRRGDPHKEMHG